MCVETTNGRTTEKSNDMLFLSGCAYVVTKSETMKQRRVAFFQHQGFIHDPGLDIAEREERTERWPESFQSDQHLF